MVVYTAIQPTGVITLGNYIGSLKNFTQQITNAKQAYLCVADLHSITVFQDPQTLAENVKQLLCIFFALGLEKQAQIFVQSHVTQHAELTWPLLTVTKMGELERMTQYKDKVQKQSTNRNVGLFTYPVLMASDILLYDTTHVPVGVDQKQHLELARDIAIRFNDMYKKEVFVVPEPIIKENGAKIFSLTDPSKKMSKSDDNPKSYITLFDDAKSIMKKIKSATTDSDTKVKYDPENKPGISNLLVIYAELKNISIKTAEAEFIDVNYGTFKTQVAQAIIDELTPIQQKAKYYYENFSIITDILAKNNLKITKIAQKKVNSVYQTMGLSKEKND